MGSQANATRDKPTSRVVRTKDMGSHHSQSRTAPSRVRKCPVWLINRVERAALAVRYALLVENRRRNVRIRAGLRFTFAWSDGKDPVTDEPREFFELFRTVDVSAGGARVTPHIANGLRPRIGITGQAAFVLDGVEVRTEAMVVRAVGDGFAVRFRSLSQPDESRVVAWIFRQEALALARRIPA